MRIIYSGEARTALDGILESIGSNYPTTYEPFRKHFDAVLARLVEFPESAQSIGAPAGMRVVPLIKYPYRLFYRYRADEKQIEIVYIRHTAQADPPFGN